MCLCSRLSWSGCVLFDSSQDYQSAKEAILQWREEIATLCQQAEVSLVIMDEVASTLLFGFANNPSTSRDHFWPPRIH